MPLLRFYDVASVIQTAQLKAKGAQRIGNCREEVGDDRAALLEEIQRVEVLDVGDTVFKQVEKGVTVGML